MPLLPRPSQRPTRSVARRSLVPLFALAAMAMLGLVGCGSDDSSSAESSTTAPEAQPEEPTEPPSPEDDGPGVTLPPPPPDESNIAYGTAPVCADGDPACPGDQTLDIYRSTADTDGPRPVAVWIHGGGFVTGDKTAVSAQFQPLLDDGYDMVSIDYRLTTDSGDNRFPVPIRDAKRAIRWIKANAAANNWDPERVTAIGHSAGGNIVGMLAASEDDPYLEPDDLPPELASQSSAIAAGVALTPVADLKAWEDHDQQYNSAMKYLGCLTDCDYAEGAVPTYVNSSNVPLWAMFGTDDVLAPPSDGKELADAYEKAGIGERFEYVVIDDGPEMWRGHNPDLQRLIPQIRAFLDANTGRS
ncbi:MAG: alpha/beta fold hydrolase [Microthrixaceae bacterium]